MHRTTARYRLDNVLGACEEGVEMLILMRRVNETICVGSAIQIHVLKIEHGRVKLGFSAPPAISIQRSEIRERFPTLDGAVRDRTITSDA
jgi:carbon storage regulator CsrA